MSKYKIEIESSVSGRYLSTLYVRKYFIFWFVMRNSIDELPYSNTVINWQNEFNIPDRQIILTFIKP